MELLEYTNRWNSQRLGSLFREQKKKNTHFARRNALKFTYGSIVDKPEYDMTPSLIDTYSKYTLVDEGDIVINCLNLNYDFVSQRVAIVKNSGIITSAYISLRARNADINSLYYCYYFKAMDARKMFHGMGTGIRLTLSYNELRNVLLPIPPRAEQDQIVRFLDWKVSEINKLIGIRRKEIQELEEYRTVKLTSITHYGLDKNRTLKDTGYSWIGAIPADWHVRAFSKVASVKSNIVQPESYMEEMQVSPASIEKNTGKIIKTQTVKESGIISGNHRFYQGQILYSKVRPLLNKVAIAPFDGLCSADMYPIETALDTKYFLYFMLSQNFLGQLSMSGNRVKMPKINQDELSSVLILFPDIKEQKLIAKKLDQLFALVDGQIERIKQNTSLLQELKSVVISDVVTGKIDVRNVTVPEYEHVDDFVDDDCENHEETDVTETNGEEA